MSTDSEAKFVLLLLGLCELSFLLVLAKFCWWAVKQVQLWMG